MPIHTVPPLPYAYDALEPFIDASTTEIHHTKHHQTYLDKLNATLDKYPDLQQKPITDLLKELETVPTDIRPAVRNHGGGHANHSFFWASLSPQFDQAVPEPFQPLIKPFTEAALSHFGSGWAWLVADSRRQLQIYSLPNQDSPLSQGHTPLLGLDVWEHAYYLKYQNRRADYIAAWWHVVNWTEVAKRFSAV
jgi:Fe-Mn family superoxide dismutase